jgi:hypothetical protein
MNIVNFFCKYNLSAFYLKNTEMLFILIVQTCYISGVPRGAHFISNLHKWLDVRAEDDCVVETCCLYVLTSTYVALASLTIHNTIKN